MTGYLTPIRLAFVVTCALAVAVVNEAPRSYAQQTEPSVIDSPVHLTLPGAIDMAIAHSHKLELARLSVRDGQEQKRVAESHFYPTISNASAVHHITELEGVVLPAGALSHGTSGGPIPAETLRIDQGASTSYTSGTGLEQPLTQLFKIHAGVKAAEADLRSAQIQAGDAENATVLRVHQLYYSYLIEDLHGDAIRDAIDAATKTEDENKQGVREGRLLADTELKSRADLLDKQEQALASKLSLDDLTLQLDDILGLPLGTKVVLDPGSLGDSPALPSRADAIAQVLEKNPNVLAARQSVEKARAGFSAARDAYIPNITGIARYSYQSGLPFFVHNFGIFGASFTYDLFDGGAREANVRDAKVKLAMAETQLAQSENDIRIELSAAYDKEEQLEQLVKVAQIALDARQESHRIQSQRAAVNAELASGVATTNAAVTEAKLNVLNTKLNLLLAQSDIERLLGERP